MIDRAPEMLRKRLGAREMKLVSLVILSAPIAVLVGTGISFALPFDVTSMGKPGPHGLWNSSTPPPAVSPGNGSAFAGFTGKVTEPGQTADSDQQWTNAKGMRAGAAQRKDSVKVFTCSVKEPSRTVAQPLEWV